MKAPNFWAKDGYLPQILDPLGRLFKVGGAIRQLTTPVHVAGIPVICVGNLVVGGAGKTPIALSLAGQLAKMGQVAAFLTRGYGGRLIGPIQVDPSVHDARDVGDEALLLAEIAPTWVSRNRGKGGDAARDAGAEIIIMDDGFQNPGLTKTLSLVVVDGGYGFGNGRMLPAGPLREPIAQGLERASVVVLIGTDEAKITGSLPKHLPVLRATISPIAHDRLRVGVSVLGFAGIGRPSKFRASLETLGLKIAHFKTFADHHSYTANEIQALLSEAERLGAVPVTTAKDYVRLPADVRSQIERLDIAVRWEDEAALLLVLEKGLGHGQG
jgi:tetraacyldisaccharide 4'-kinase